MGPGRREDIFGDQLVVSAIERQIINKESTQFAKEENKPRRELGRVVGGEVTIMCG